MSIARKSLVLLVLVGYILTSAGCAAVWFLAGAGTAATTLSVMDEEKKEKAKEK